MVFMNVRSWCTEHTGSKICCYSLMTIKNHVRSDLWRNVRQRSIALWNWRGKPLPSVKAVGETKTRNITKAEAEGQTLPPAGHACFLPPAVPLQVAEHLSSNAAHRRQVAAQRCTVRMDCLPHDQPRPLLVPGLSVAAATAAALAHQDQKSRVQRCFRRINPGRRSSPVQLPLPLLRPLWLSGPDVAHVALLRHHLGQHVGRLLRRQPPMLLQDVHQRSLQIAGMF